MFRKKQLYFSIFLVYLSKKKKKKSGTLITLFKIFFALYWIWLVCRSDGLIQLWTWKLTRGMIIYIFRYIEQHPFSVIVVTKYFCNLKIGDSSLIRKFCMHMCVNFFIFSCFNVASVY